MVAPMVFAHRGYSSQAPENTLPAFQAAADIGADGVELDVQLTADGEVVVIHDESLRRTTNGSGMVYQKTLAEIKALDAGAWFAPRFTGVQIPTLDEVVDLLAPYPQMRINIELKTGIIPYPGIVEKVVQTVLTQNLSQRVIISSFNHHSLLEVKALAPQIPIGLLYVGNLICPWEYATTVGAEALHPQHHGISRETVMACHGTGKQINVWTVDQEADLVRCVKAGVDGIITNYPERAQDLINSSLGSRTQNHGDMGC